MKNSKETVKTPFADEPVIEPKQQATDKPEVQTKPEPVTGTVTGCVKLRVRKEPSTKGEVLTELPVNSTVQINMTKSTDEWFKVRAKGVNGFCMKQYITIG